MNGLIGEAEGLDILLLTLLGSTTQQDDQSMAVLAETDPLVRDKVDPEFEDTGSRTLSVGEAPWLHLDQCRRQLGCSLSLQLHLPFW